MDGKERLQAQLSSGTRQRVAFVDGCRLKYGLTRVTSLTPKVETRLRSGYEAAIALKVRYISNNGEVAATLTLHKSYPFEPIQVSLSLVSSQGLGEPTADSEYMTGMVRTLQEHCNACVIQEDFAETIVPVGLDTFEVFESLLNQLSIGASTDADNLGGTNSQMRVGTSEDGYSELDKAAEAEGVITASTTPTATTTTTNTTVTSVYRCTKCRSFLFHFSDLVSHAPTNATAGCTSLFLHSVPDNNDDKKVGIQRVPSGGGDELLAAQKGVLACAKCNIKLGIWSWVGFQCSCREWVSPAFQVTSSRVDLDTR